MASIIAKDGAAVENRGGRREIVFSAWMMRLLVLLAGLGRGCVCDERRRSSLEERMMTTMACVIALRKAFGHGNLTSVAYLDAWAC